MSLKAKLVRRIGQMGPITVAEFMTACLHDPEFGYYATRPALGAEGDFVTAPLVSQMFGELIGVWAVDLWMQMGRPAPFRLVELGPGDGALMSDLLRAARLAPDFRAAAELWLVETSAPLRKLQGAALRDHAPKWAASLDEVQDGAPILLVANELLDCLPARQFVRTERGWGERMVGTDGSGALRFGLTAAAETLVPDALREAPAGSLVEVSPAQANLGRAVGERIAVDGGAALFIDYGRSAPEYGDTLQALLEHKKVDVLATAGEADLTIHADFPAFADAARAGGAETTPIVTQREFLRALGIEARTAALSSARPDLTQSLARQLHRLTAPKDMGDLFKVVAIHSPGLRPPGFETLS